MIAVSTLLKSCAMPPASWPIACIFWLWAKFSCSVRCSVVSSAKTMRARALVALRIGGGNEEARRARRLARRARRRPARCRPCRRWRRRSRRRARRGRARRRRRRSTVGSARRPASAPRARGARRRRWRAARAPSAPTEAIAIGVELKKRAKRTSAARKSSPASSPGARLSTSVREAPGSPALEKATRCSSRTGRNWPWRRLRSTSNRSVVTSPGRPETTLSSAAPSAGDDVGELELAGGELGDVVVEPVGQRRVDIDDRAVRLGGEEAGRRMVEIVDRVLQVLEEVLVALALARDVGDDPQRRAAPRDAFERPHADAIPAGRALAGQRRRHAQFLDARDCPRARPGRAGRPPPRLPARR